METTDVIKFSTFWFILFLFFNTCCIPPMQKKSSSAVAEKKTLVVFLCVPVSPGKSRLIFIPARNFFLWIDRIIPRWISHIEQNLVLDSDLCLLHVQVISGFLFNAVILEFVFPTYIYILFCHLCRRVSCRKLDPLTGTKLALCQQKLMPMWWVLEDG